MRLEVSKSLQKIMTMIAAFGVRDFNRTGARLAVIILATRGRCTRRAIADRNRQAPSFRVRDYHVG